jgi:hypothetical protein
MNEIEDIFAALRPATDKQRQLLTSAKSLAGTIVPTQLPMSRQIINPVPALLVIVVLGWASLLFLGFGLVATFTTITVIAEALGAISVASAMFVIFPFSQPYSGTFSISSSGIDGVLASLIADETNA